MRFSAAFVSLAAMIGATSAAISATFPASLQVCQTATVSATGTSGSTQLVVESTQNGKTSYMMLGTSHRVGSAWGQALRRFAGSNPWPGSRDFEVTLPAGTAVTVSILCARAPLSSRHLC
jgi:hypothetical protein